MHPLKEQIINYCLSLPHTEETFPFDTHTWVVKVHGKMFVLMDILAEEVRINVKCKPEKAEELRMEYDCIQPGYHMNKKHWNTINCTAGGLDWLFIKSQIDHSYTQVLASIPKSKRTKNA